MKLEELPMGVLRRLEAWLAEELAQAERRLVQAAEAGESVAPYAGATKAIRQLRTRVLQAMEVKNGRPGD